MLEEWEEQLLKKHKGKRSLLDAKRLVRKMEIEGQTFANRVLTLLKGDSGLTCRTTVLYMAFEMIKIDCPDKTLKDPGAIAARKVLCQGWKLDYSKVEKELTAIRGYIQDNLYGKQEQAAKDNLLAFLNGHVARHGEFWATKPNAMRYIGRVITTSVTSHFVEQLFSTLKHETTGKRVNTKVETVAHYLHLKSMPTIKEEPDPEDGNFPIEPPPPPPWP